MQLSIDSYVDFKTAVTVYGTPSPLFYRFVSTTLVVNASCNGVVVKGSDNVNPPTSGQFLTDFPHATLMTTGFDLNT